MTRLILEENVTDCPICGDSMEHSDTEVDGNEYEDTYICRACEVFVTYITPNDGREYHEYSSIKIRLEKL